MLCEGDIIIPPCNAADVTIRDLDLTRIEILRKRPNPLQKGCWDIELKYVFNYTLEFRRADGCFIGTIDATSSHHLRVTLFGVSPAATPAIPAIPATPAIPAAATVIPPKAAAMLLSAHPLQLM